LFKFTTALILSDPHGLEWKRKRKSDALTDFFNDVKLPPFALPLVSGKQLIILLFTKDGFNTSLLKLLHFLCCFIVFMVTVIGELPRLPCVAQQ